MISYRSGKVLIVDDQEDNLVLLRKLLEREGYRDILALQSGAQVWEAVQDFGPDIVLLDLFMPQVDGFEVLRTLRARLPQDQFLPVLVLTADGRPESRQRALALGAKDFLTKPFDVVEVSLRVANLLESRAMYLSLQGENRQLNALVRSRTHELAQSRLEVLERLAHAAEYRDDETGEHVRRVAALSASLAHARGLGQELTEQIERASALHDVGKIGIPDAILRKPGPLDPAERRTMQAHTTIGKKLLEGGRSEFLLRAEEIAYAHHERWDGRGYPQGLSGEQIPLSARIVALADVHDALIHERPYKAAWPAERALEEIRRGRGTHFDPELTELFLELELPS